MGSDKSKAPPDHEAVALVLSAQQLARDIDAWADCGQAIPDGHVRFLRTLLRDVGNARPRDLARMLRLPADGDWPEPSGPHLGGIFQAVVREPVDEPPVAAGQVGEMLGATRAVAPTPIATVAEASQNDGGDRREKKRKGKGKEKKRRRKKKP